MDGRRPSQLEKLRRHLLWYRCVVIKNDQTKMVALCSKSSAPTIISYKHNKRLIVTSSISLRAIYVTDVRALFIDITD